MMSESPVNMSPGWRYARFSASPDSEAQANGYTTISTCVDKCVTLGQIHNFARTSRESFKANKTLQKVNGESFLERFTKLSPFTSPSLSPRRKGERRKESKGSDDVETEEFPEALTAAAKM